MKQLMLWSLLAFLPLTTFGAQRAPHHKSQGHHQVVCHDGTCAPATGHCHEEGCGNCEEGSCCDNGCCDDCVGCADGSCDNGTCDCAEQGCCDEGCCEDGCDGCDDGDCPAPTP